MRKKIPARQAIRNTQIDGDISVGRNIAMGGDASVQGDTLLKGNATVEGWLIAANVVSTHKGYFDSVEELKFNYQHPQDGWWSFVGETLYVVHKGEWRIASGTFVEGDFEAMKMAFISKLRPDSTRFLLRLLGGAEVGEAVDSMLTGKGTILTKDGRIQTDYLEVRRGMKVMELIVNKLRGMDGDFVFSPTWKVVEVEYLLPATYRLTLDPPMDGDIIPYREGNILYSIINGILTGGDTIQTSYMRVLATNQNEYSITVSLYPDSEVPGGKNCPPVEGYNISRRGDVRLPSDGQSNPDSQSWYISSSEGRLLFLQNVIKPVLEDYNYALSIGKFPRIKAIEEIGLPEDAVGVMAETIVAQNIYHYDYNGDIVPNIVYRGNWSLQVATSAKPYRNVTVKSTTPSGDRITKLEQHTVTHLGCVWGCLVDKTTDEPKWNAQGWQLMEGDTNYSMTFESSEGFTFFRGNVNTQIDVVLWYGNMDITADVKQLVGVEVEWLRDSGNVPADNSWRPQYADDSKLSIRLSNADVTPNFGLSIRKVKFVCNCYIPIGKDKIEKVSQEIGFKF